MSNLRIEPARAWSTFICQSGTTALRALTSVARVA